MNREDQKHIKQALAKNHACYVLITCDEPTENGEMQVQMCYEGDAALASYLLQGAQTIIDEREDGSSVEMTASESKINYMSQYI